MQPPISRIGQWPGRDSSQLAPASHEQRLARTGIELSDLECVIDSEVEQPNAAPSSELVTEPGTSEQTQATTNSKKARPIDYDRCEWFHVLIAIIILLVVMLAGFTIMTLQTIINNFVAYFICLGFILVVTASYAGVFVFLTEANHSIRNLLERYIMVPRSLQRELLRFVTFCYLVVIIVAGGRYSSLRWYFQHFLDQLGICE